MSVRDDLRLVYHSRTLRDAGKKALLMWAVFVVTYLLLVWLFG